MIKHRAKLLAFAQKMGKAFLTGSQKNSLKLEHEPRNDSFTLTGLYTANFSHPGHISCVSVTYSASGKIVKYSVEL